MLNKNCTQPIHNRSCCCNCCYYHCCCCCCCSCCCCCGAVAHWISNYWARILL